MKETIKTKILIIGMLLILLSSFSMDIDKNKIRADFEIYKITFDSQDSTLVGYESVFCYNETSDVYAIKENDTLFEKCTYPYSTEQKQGYVVTFLGWYDIYGEEIIRYNQDGFEDGSKLKLLTSTTYTTLTGNWHLSCDITLYPKFSYDALPSKINFVTSSSQVIISGTNYAYIDYDSEHLCKDSLCLEYLEKSGFPVAQKYQLGYTYEFLGWFSSMEDSAKQVFDSNNTLIKNVEGFTDENGKWKHLGNVALYPQFEENPIVVKITLTIEENVVIDGVDTIYVAYMQNILYSDKELKEPIQNVTTAQKQGIGYEYIFDGWKNINGKCVINKNGELNTFVGGYTDEEGRWTLTEDCELYPLFIEKALVLKINFNVEDTNAVITGNTTLYSKYNSNLFYYDVLCTKMGTTPLVRKQKIGYTVELDGWYIDNQKVMTKNGALLPNISNITNENGMFVTTNELTLVAKIKETPFTYYVNFCVGENEAINGESKLYISYDDNVFYLEEEKVTTRPIPTAQKHIEGYDSIFLGWYESTNANSSKFIDKNGNFVEGRVFKNGKFANLSSLTMYAKFEITPKVIEISFNCETIIPLEYDKVYVKYNSSIFYKEKECINQVEIPVPKKEIEGYECNFVGYFIEEEYTNKVFDYKGNIRQNVLDITNKYYNWIGLNDLTLYAKFDIKKIIYKIKIDSMEGELENENQHTIFVPYDSNKYYLTQDCEEEITTFPNSILNQKGYDTQLIGYYTQAENGEKIVDESLKIQSSVLGFTNENGNWTRLEDCTIYARYNLEPKTIKINFSSVDNENNTIIIQGNVDYYVKFDSNTFYSDVELQNEIKQFPTIKEQDNDFDYNFFGWCIKNEQDHIRLIDENGNLCKVVNYTCYDLNDEFCICTDQDITLIPCYTKQGVTIMLTFNTEEKEQQLTGNQTYYCKFGSKELYKDHSCQNETQELPKVTQEVIGYSSEFLGWYSGSGQLIFDKNLVMQQNADGVIKDGTWQFSNSIILYPKFNLIPNMYQITLDSQDGTLEGYQEKKVLTLFVEYGSNVIYIDRQKTQEAHLVNAEKNIQGYNSTFIGWEDENGNIIFKNGEKDLIASIPTLTDKKGNWIATKDLILTSKFLDEAIISKIILNVVDSQTENNISSIYVKYDDKNIYYDEYCLNALEKFPSSTRQVDGYTFNFSGWFELQESQKMVVSSDCQIVNFNEFYYNGWKIIKTLNLYPQFNQNQNMYEIEFINKYTTDSKVGYILYNSSTIYQDKDLMNEFAYLPTCEKMGYDVEFIGWELKNENQLLIDIEYKFLSVLGYVREGNYYYTNNLKVYANFKFIPRLYTITINSNGGKIENLQENTQNFYILYDTDVFYLTQEKNDSDIITIPSSILEKKGYTVKFVGYKYQGELIIKDGNLITSTNYIKNGVWDIASSELIELKAEYTFTPNVYKVEFFNDSELINSLYIEYDSNEFYLERELLTKQNPTKLQDNQIESLYFSGYYTNNGIWIINQDCELILTDENVEFISKNTDRILWNIDYNISLYASYKSKNEMTSINLIITHNEYGNNYLDREIFIDKNTNDLYLDVFKNLKVSNEINSLKVKSFNEKCYSITFYGYYTRPDGEGEKLIDENGSLIILDINDFIENGKWIAENGQNLYAYYKIEPKEFKVTFDTIKSGGELSTVQTDYYVKYLTKDLLDKNQNIKDIPIAYKRLQGYTITFLGYKNKNDEFVIEYKDEQFKIVPNINGFTDENSNFIFSEDVILYATFKEDIITYDAYYYNYDGTIFEVIDLNLNDYLILPSSNPTKVLDNGKEYLFKYWIGYNYNTTTIMKDSKHFYPYFEEYDKREISDEGKTVFVNTFENIAKVYIKDFDNVERLKISLNNYKFEFDKNFCQMLFLNEFKSYGDCLILEVKEINNLEENKTLYNDLFNYKTYQISIKINETLVNLSGRIEIEINQILQDEEPKKAFTVNQKFKTKNEIDSAYKESKITFILSSLSDEIIIVANQDLSKQGNFIKTLLKIAIFLVLGIIFLVIIVVIVKKVIVILEDKKYNEKFSKQDLVSTSQNTEMDLKQQEFFEKLGTNSLLTKATKTNNQQFSQEEKSKQILQDKQDQDRLKNLKEKLENEKNKDN